jgi:hypothetical protein
MSDERVRAAHERTKDAVRAQAERRGVANALDYARWDETGDGIAPRSREPYNTAKELRTVTTLAFRRGVADCDVIAALRNEAERIESQMQFERDLEMANDG